MKRLSAFMWGYWGWGNHTRELVRTVDAIEKSRSKNPPIFVDIRYSRKVRASGFHNDNFAEAVGRRYYYWIKELGNKNIGNDGRIKIADATGVVELLQLIIKANEEDRRVIFFCACAEPCYCHRTHVARLAVKAAHWHGIDLTIVEWPGGRPLAIALPVEHNVVRKALKDATRIPLDGLHPRKQQELKALPWCSRIDLRSDVGHAAIVTGPAHCAAAGWYLPVIGRWACKPSDTLSSLKDHADRARKSWGYAPINLGALGKW